MKNLKIYENSVMKEKKSVVIKKALILTAIATSGFILLGCDGCSSCKSNVKEDNLIGDTLDDYEDTTEEDFNDKIDEILSSEEENSEENEDEDENSKSKGKDKNKNKKKEEEKEKKELYYGENTALKKAEKLAEETKKQPGTLGDTSAGIDKNKVVKGEDGDYYKTKEDAENAKKIKDNKEVPSEIVTDETTDLKPGEVASETPNNYFIANDGTYWTTQEDCNKWNEYLKSQSQTNNQPTAPTEVQTPVEQPTYHDEYYTDPNGELWASQEDYERYNESLKTR